MPLPSGLYGPTGAFIDTVLSGSGWDVSTGAGGRTFTWAIADNSFELFGWDAGLAVPIIADALSEISSVVNVNFSYVGHYADPLFAPADLVYSGTFNPGIFGAGAGTIAFAYYPTAANQLSGNPYFGAAGDVWINATRPEFSLAALQDGGAAKFVALHETGHALGLKHSFEASGGFASVQQYGFADNLADRHDSVINQSVTVMSYDYASFFSSNVEGNPATLMPLDILALGYLYGLRPKDTGDTTHALFADGAFETFYDTDGTDLITAASSTWGWTIDLGVTVDVADLYPAEGEFILGFAQPVNDENTFKWLVDPENAFGSEQADVLFGNDGPNILAGFGGNDLVEGGDGADSLWGVAGNDNLSGEAGNDRLFGNAGDDSIAGGDGDDLAKAHPGDDTVRGDNGNDLLFGGANDDNLDGGAGNDTANGNSGFDTINGGAGNDIIRGQGGQDSLNGGDGDDQLVGMQGFDTLVGGAGNDTLLAGPANDTLTGGAGADIFTFAANQGTNTVTDFELGVDQLSLTGPSGLSSLNTTATANGTQVTFSGTTILLNGITPAQLEAGDFAFA